MLFHVVVISVLIKCATTVSKICASCQPWASNHKTWYQNIRVVIKIDLFYTKSLVKCFILTMITHHCLTWLEGVIHEENVLVLIYGNSNLFFCLKKKRYCCIIDGSGYCVKMSPCSTPDHEVPTLCLLSRCSAGLDWRRQMATELVSSRQQRHQGACLVCVLLNSVLCGVCTTLKTL